jgi:hypothetical protein
MQMGVLSNLAPVVNIGQLDHAASRLPKLLHLGGEQALR